MGRSPRRSTAPPSTRSRSPRRSVDREVRLRSGAPDRSTVGGQESAACRSSLPARPVPRRRGAGRVGGGSRVAARARARRTQPLPSRRCAARATLDGVRAATARPGGRRPIDPSCADGSAASDRRRTAGTDACHGRRRSTASVLAAAVASAPSGVVAAARGSHRGPALPAPRECDWPHGGWCRPRASSLTMADSLSQARPAALPRKTLARVANLQASGLVV